MSVESRRDRRALRQRTGLPPHGTRARYQLACRCLPCRLANAEYTVLYRRLERRHQRPARALVDGKTARSWVRAMLAEGFTKVLIARELGTKEFRGVGALVTVARHQALERLYATRVADPYRGGVTEYAAVQNGAE
jgi:hypothetical protein